jgi:exopolysaccharide biosynthesis polyprenyl glycosylphosphotransferase
MAVIFAYAVLVVLSCTSQDLYRTPRDRGILEETLIVLKAVSFATVVLVLFVFAFGATGITRTSILALGVLTGSALSGWRSLKRRLILSRTLRGIGVSRVLIVGEERTGRALAACLGANPSFGYKVCGFLEAESSPDAQILGRRGELERVLAEQFIDEVFLTPPIDREVVKKFVLVARQLRIGLKVVPDLYDGIGWRAPVHTIGGFPVLELNENPIPGLGVAIKRFLDVVIAGGGLVVTAPLLVLLAAIVRLDSPGGAFYPATRIGYKGRRFCCWKLRTMLVGADGWKDALRETNERAGPWFKMKNDPRITRVGRWLRKFSLDELPQLWNVLSGDMSLVGPRPHPVDDFNRYQPEHLRRLDVKPGVTGLWQVTARRDPSFETNLALDLEYIENWSLRLDFEILFRSLAELWKGSGE